ncbi:hypothetical protein KQI42_18255 [Tissierella sp. MSJ-40]|uniref:Uncharacterized protein n=1 Tax=Tissierella simiarum TaxID=2841534 RepID=A0ABS6EBQ9_9FIRM|nr:hypothetical protein [Tissierella simiarum]MBU5439956.1 hypothetical protein [Tissierella simiarum]
MGNSKLLVCRDTALSFLKGRDAVHCLEFIIDIYDGVRYTHASEEEIMQKLMRIIHNLVDSAGLSNLMEEEQKKVFDEFIIKFLNIEFEDNKYVIKNEHFSKLSLDEFYQAILWTKCFLEDNGENLEASFL